MKALLLLISCICLFLSSTVSAQTKTISNQEITIGGGVYFEASMDASIITVTIQGPSDRWLAVAFGLGMADGDAIIYTDGKLGAMHALGVWDYDLNAQSVAGVSKDTQNDWSLISNTTNAGMRTIVASRSLNTGDPIDHIINFGDAAIDLIWSKGNTASNTLAYHGLGNRGAASLVWTVPDLTPPQLAVNPFSPADNEVNVSLGASGVVNFNEDIIVGTGNIELHLLSNGALVEQYDVTTSPNLSITANQLTINPSTNLSSFTAYYFTIDPGAITDLAANAYPGFTDNATWNFTTLDNSGDVTPPSLVASPFSPIDNAVSVPETTNLIVTFDEDVQLATGNITLLRLSDDFIIESFDVTSSLNVTANGPEVTIDPTNDLLVNSEYYVTIDQGAIEDLSSNPYNGFADNSTWNFATPLAGLDELSDLFSLEMLPNSSISIVNNSEDNCSLKIFNLSGQILVEKELLKGKQKIDLEKYSNMSLIINVSSSNGQLSKLIKL